jgi:serine/threonine-protein kinase ULK/ATG1
MSHPPQVGDYIVTGVLGSGSFAVVYRAKHVTSGLLVAIKSIRRDKLSRKLQENLEAEISILKALNHPNVVKLHSIEVCVEFS